jgi:hypothetical protein
MWKYLLVITWCFKASVYCRSCQFNHPRPVGTNCIFQAWLQQLDDMSGEEAPIPDAASQVSNAPIITGDAPVTSTPTILTATSTATSCSLPTDTVSQGVSLLDRLPTLSTYRGMKPSIALHIRKPRAERLAAQTTHARR